MVTLNLPAETKPAESKLLKMGISYKFERTKNDVCLQMLIHKVTANMV